jgi:DNA-directed RNA polymerase specialized sigma24 family protein
MTDIAAHSAPGEAALAAFLRGIERRGFVLAEAQCGDPVRAQAAIDAATRTFRAEAAQLPLARWPAFFWQHLLAQPVLRELAKSSADQPLARLSAGPRAALLLRLVAGLDQAHGAEVLRVSPEAYRHALYRALRALHAQGIDDAQLRALRERLQLRAKQLPDTAHRVPPARIAARTAHPLQVAARAPRWLRMALLAMLAILLLALGATYFWKPASPTAAPHFGTLRAQAPAETLSATAAVLASADFGLLDDPDGAQIARDLDLYAWYAAAPNAAASDQAAPAPLPESTAPETSAPDAEAAPTEGGREH